MTQPDASPTSRVTTWLIDPKHTFVEFAATHMMVATVKGRFSGVSGTIRADESDIARSTVEVAIDAASLDTHEGRRDRHLRSSDFLDVERYPEIVFTSTSVQLLDPGHLRVAGDLTIRGTTRSVVLDTRLNGKERSPDGYRVASFSAEAEINRQDFGLVWNQTLESGGVLVGDRIRLHLEVQTIEQE
jgi:polyisoprenoid-binding protein YceI